MRCQAKDPSTCRYHSALRRLAQAAQNGDATAYLRERALVESMNQNAPGSENGPLIGEKHERILSELNDLFKKDVTEPNRSFKNRTKYLKDAEAVPTPMEVYALWLSVYESQGNKIPESKIPLGAYNSLGNVISDDEELKEKRITHKSIAWKRWTPTKGGTPIPPGYGSAHLEILVLSDLVDQPLDKTTNDKRPGWEYGHSIVYVLRHDPSSPSGYRAETNSSRIKTFSDVEQYRKGKTFSEMVASFTSSFGKITK